MNTKSTVIAAATLALMIIAAPAQVMAQAAPGNGGGGSSGAAGGEGGGGEGGTYGFGSAYHNIETGEHSCDYLRKRAQWSNAHYWWQKYSRCISN